MVIIDTYNAILDHLKEVIPHLSYSDQSSCSIFGIYQIIDPCAPYCWEATALCSYRLAYTQEHSEDHESVSDVTWNLM